MATKIPREERLTRPVVPGTVYEARFACSPEAIVFAPEDMVARLEDVLPIEVLYCGSSSAGDDLYVVIFKALDFPPPNPAFTATENRSIGYLCWLVGNEINKHRKQGVVPTLLYGIDVWVHDEFDPAPVEEKPKPQDLPFVPPVPVPDFGRLGNLLKWGGVAAATIVGGRYFRVWGAVLGGGLAALILQPKELRDFEAALQGKAVWLAAGGVALWLALRGGRNGSAEREQQPA